MVNGSMSLQGLVQALHLKPPQFATPELNNDIASTPPTLPTMHINIMELQA